MTRNHKLTEKGAALKEQNEHSCIPPEGVCGDVGKSICSCMGGAWRQVGALFSLSITFAGCPTGFYSLSVYGTECPRVGPQDPLPCSRTG